jgi:hypothetical protein
MARDPKRQRLVDTSIFVGELDLEIVDGCGERHVIR